MYKVFLVEDEIFVRESMIESDVWKGKNFVLVGDAADGEMALPLIEEIMPDILITDIKMPFMDGLELSRIVKKNMQDIKIIILSGYDEFSYAKEAMNIGITKYILKPVSSEDLLEALNEVSKEIDKEKKERDNYKNANKHLKESMEIMKERFLNDLSTGVIPTVEAIEKAKTLGVNIFSKYYIIALLILDTTESNEIKVGYSELSKAEKVINDMIDSNQDILKFNRNLKQIVLIIKGEDPNELENSCYTKAKSIKLAVEEKTECLLTISIGAVNERVQGIAESFKDAETTLKYNNIFGKHKIIGKKDTHIKKYDPNWTYGLEKDEINNFLNTGEKADIPDFISSCTERIKTNRMSLLFCSYNLINVTKTVNKFINELGGDVRNILPETDRIEEIMSNIDTLEKFNSYMDKILNIAFDFRENKSNNKYGKIIVKAKDYINKNYSKSNLNLKSVADFVNISPSHFSTVFAQETGEKFIDYLTTIRIRKAIELLKTTNLKVTEIAFEIGYKEPHYFSQLFKKVTGKSPTSYR